MPSISAEDDTIDFMTDSDDDNDGVLGPPSRNQSQQRAGRDPLEAATQWADVDMKELEHIALRIACTALPPDAEEAVGRVALSTVALDSANNDPLGLGRVDTRLLCLVSACVVCNPPPLLPSAHTHPCARTHPRTQPSSRTIQTPSNAQCHAQHSPPPILPLHTSPRCPPNHAATPLHPCRCRPTPTPAQTAYDLALHRRQVAAHRQCRGATLATLL